MSSRRREMTSAAKWKVGGMACGGCEENVAKAIQGACGEVREVQVDHATGLVTLLCPDPDNLPGIEAAIEAAGYTVEKA